MPREQFQSLTEPMYYILMSLQEECCGVDIMEKVKALSGGRVQVGPGTLYTLLAKFQEGDIIEEKVVSDHRKSKGYPEERVPAYPGYGQRRGRRIGGG